VGAGLKRSYSGLDPKERQKQAVDEAFFALPDGPLRSAILLYFSSAGIKRDELSAPAKQWLADRGL